jgi:hypothetical protein
MIMKVKIDIDESSDCDTSENNEEGSCNADVEIVSTDGLLSLKIRGTVLVALVSAIIGYAELRGYL